jgi:hypothetical protein
MNAMLTDALVGQTRDILRWSVAYGKYYVSVYRRIVVGGFDVRSVVANSRFLHLTSTWISIRKSRIGYGKNTFYQRDEVLKDMAHVLVKTVTYRDTLLMISSQVQHIVAEG